MVTKDLDDAHKSEGYVTASTTKLVTSPHRTCNMQKQKGFKDLFETILLWFIHSDPIFSNQEYQFWFMSRESPHTQQSQGPNRHLDGEKMIDSCSIPKPKFKFDSVHPQVPKILNSIRIPSPKFKFDFGLHKSSVRALRILYIVECACRVKCSKILNQ